MAGSDLKWVSLASSFPAGLDTETDPSKLRDGWTPDGYGMSIDYPGRLVAGAIPTGTAQVKKTYTIGANTWREYFDRMWLIATTQLKYLAPGYVGTTAAYESLLQGRGGVSFAEDANAILEFLPVANNLYVAKSTGGYMLFGTNSQSDVWRKTDIEESMKISAAANCNVLDGLAFASNGNGLMAWDGNRVTEITRDVRTSISHFQNKALLVDPQKRRIIGTDKFVFDLGMKKLFHWGTTGFRWTSRVITDTATRRRSGIRRPFGVESLAFYFDNTTQADGEITFQTRLSKEDWSDPQTLQVKWQEEKYVRQQITLEHPVHSQQFQVRITALDSHIHIHDIDMLTDLTVTTEESPAQ